MSWLKYHIQPLKMEPTQGSETSAYPKIWRRGDTQKNTHNKICTFLSFEIQSSF
jgi:cytochrome c556